MFSQGQPNSTASRAAMHSSLLSIWRFSDDELQEYWVKLRADNFHRNF
jgi:hypothetical protein